MVFRIGMLAVRCRKSMMDAVANHNPPMPGRIRHIANGHKAVHPNRYESDKGDESLEIKDGAYPHAFSITLRK